MFRWGSWKGGVPSHAQFNWAKSVFSWGSSLSEECFIEIVGYVRRFLVVYRLLVMCVNPQSSENLANSAELWSVIGDHGSGIPWRKKIDLWCLITSWEVDFRCTPISQYREKSSTTRTNSCPFHSKRSVPTFWNGRSGNYEGIMGSVRLAFVLMQVGHSLTRSSIC